eukprot:CAMPEP_0198314012 /NCGR_PEP_ID=MMETSP1450-20131203/4846_1 /TAXON_ID=753684 ORGANISM="Madagascaria erythrocladiodes, Strain CCMP3234" /NCGR_SAMPLE_ID=MMETSP1450 /ASSEMBLY_ACC=CAM_ASM_001115 /LENGTH=332 /DNA_ID=CAMNT_0044017049 /DNA_START=345 /DNA_END=1343 /DNA_ORIENTATION=-
MAAAPTRNASNSNLGTLDVPRNFSTSNLGLLQHNFSVGSNLGYLAAGPQPSPGTTIMRNMSFGSNLGAFPFGRNGSVPSFGDLENLAEVDWAAVAAGDEQKGMTKSDSVLWSPRRMRSADSEREKKEIEWQNRLRNAGALLPSASQLDLEGIGVATQQRAAEPCPDEDPETSVHSDEELPSPRKTDAETGEVQSPRAPVKDLKGTTSAMSRKMTDNERDLMLLKRKLRNRQSAARSRKRHQAILQTLQQDLGTLTERADKVTAACENCSMQNGKLREENMRLYCENAYLRAQLSMVMSDGATAGPLPNPPVHIATVGYPPSGTTSLLAKSRT